MRKDIINLPIAVVFLAALVVVVFQFGCDGASGPGRTDEQYNYRFEGVFVEDPNIDSVSSVVHLERNDTLMAGAMVVIDDKMLCYANGVYELCDHFADSPSTVAFNIELIDPTKFGDTFQVVVPANFSIDMTATIPNIRQKFSSDHVILSWFGSAGVESGGYIIAAVKHNLAYTGVGYSRYVTAAEATSATFNDTAFAHLPDLLPDTGLYYLYVYAFAGKPDSALSSNLLPVPLPSQLDDNIDLRDLTGRMGAIVVTRYDSMYVVIGN